MILGYSEEGEKTRIEAETVVPLSEDEEEAEEALLNDSLSSMDH